MPTSKKPRRKYHRKVFLVDQFSMTPEHASAISKEFEVAQIAAEMKLGFGKCTKEEMWKMRDIFNLVAVAWSTRSEEELDTDAINELQPEFLAGQNALADVMIKGFARRGEPVFICTGNQLQVILEGLHICGEFLEYSVRYTPQRLVKEYLALKSLLAGKEGKYSFSQSTLERAIEKVTVGRLK